MCYLVRGSLQNEPNFRVRDQASRREVGDVLPNRQRRREPGRVDPIKRDIAGVTRLLWHLDDEVAGWLLRPRRARPDAGVSRDEDPIRKPRPVAEDSVVEGGSPGG